jgi:hypothetical protein
MYFGEILHKIFCEIVLEEIPSFSGEVPRTLGFVRTAALRAVVPFDEFGETQQPVYHTKDSPLKRWVYSGAWDESQVTSNREVVERLFACSERFDVSVGSPTQRVKLWCKSNQQRQRK